MTAAIAAATFTAVAATVLADIRWLRVAQREHYLAGSVTRFALRWWRLGPNRLLGAAAVLGVVLSPISPFTGLIGALAIAVGPFRYAVRGRSPGPVVWTARLKNVAALTAGVQSVLVAAGIVLGAAVPVASVVALLTPLIIDGALRGLSPLEARRASTFVDQARARLEEIKPTIVGITGSYGKTTTKVYAAHLMSGGRRAVPTPASFNNTAGLSRAINEHLVPGTEVFVAEMGTYGKGEIADMCSWCPPRVAAITAIGPVHLERFITEDAIVVAKSEILETADIVVLNVDDPRLAAVADRQAAAGKRVVRCSVVDPLADVSVRTSADGRLDVSLGGSHLASVEAPDVSPGNVAVAVALALSVDVPPAMVAAGLQSLPPVANRRAEVVLSTGATAVDDTFNSNPAGCRAALAALSRLGAPGGSRVVVTPGMVELGPSQAPENTAFATLAATTATHLVIVGFTNRAALLAGAMSVPAEERAQLLFADIHERAVDWVRANTSAGDVVLYEGQLPDHYP